MKAIVTVLGRDRVGIIASVCALLSEYNINILDISQTILEQGYFTMVLLSIRIQREDIFNAMHRI